jgi:hypothetical protein
MNAKSRIVMVREVGDHWRNSVRGLGPELMVRVQGKWLQEAGFRDGQEVYIYNPKPGQLVLMTEVPVSLPIPAYECQDSLLIAHYVREK